MTLDEWLESNNATREHIREDAEGKYIRGKVELSTIATSFPKIYLPKDLI